MERSPELKKKLKEDTEFNFFDFIGNALHVAEIYQNLYEKSRDPKYAKKLDEAKDEFFRRIEEFESSGYIPTDKINSDTIAVFYSFKNLDWSDEENIEKAKQHLSSLKS